MSDESGVQEDAAHVLADNGAQPEMQVNRQQFKKILHQALAAKDLFIHLQSIVEENKRLREKNENLERIQNRYLRQVVISENTGSKDGGNETMHSLPTHFNFDNQPKDLEGKRCVSLQDVGRDDMSSRSNVSSQLTESYASTLIPSSTKSDVSTDCSRTSVPDKDILYERGISCSKADIQQKSDSCKDQETGLSLKTDGDVRSMTIIPHFLPSPTKHHLQTHDQHQYTLQSKEINQFAVKQSSKLISPQPVHIHGNVSPTVSPSMLSPPVSMGPPSYMSRVSMEDTELVNQGPASMDDVNVVTNGVSKHYFDVVVKELAKSKQLIKQLIARSGENPKDVMDALYLKELVKSLEEENKKLCESNQYVRKLLVNEATTDARDMSANNEILNFHDKVRDLERQVELKDIALQEVHKQCDVWKRYGQKTMAQQYTSPPRHGEEDGVFQPQLQHTETQTEQEDLLKVVASTQTEGVPSNQHAPDKMATMLDRAQKQVQYLEGMVGNLNVDNHTLQEKVELVTSQNTNLERSYHQVLQTLEEQERNQNTRVLQEDIQRLTRENKDMSRTLKDTADEIKYLRYQLQKVQNEQGNLRQQKTHAETALKSERERANQREVLLSTQCSKLQKQIWKLEADIEKLKTSFQPSKTFMEPPQLSAYEPTSMPLLSQKHQDDGGQRMGRFHQSNPCLNLGESEAKEEEYLCHHCFRTDFKDEKSYLNHMQKCGD